MSPAVAIASLDQAISDCGEDIVLRRTSYAGTTASHADRTVRAHVRGYQPQELIGNIAQGDRKVILSPSGLGGNLPMRGECVLIDGRSCLIEAAPAIWVGGVVVRIELQVRG